MGKRKEETANSKDDIDNIEEAQTSEKKVRLFATREFRNQLKSEDKITALSNFGRLLTQEPKQDCVREYLENGGSCLELVHILNDKSGVPASLILDIIYKVFLRISANLPQYQSSAYDACRYLLNNHITMINKMLALTSSDLEKKSVLKLLTTIVTFSPTLAKDILLQVQFYPKNLHILTKRNKDRDSVRSAFVKFLTSFLVDGRYPTLAVLLEKHTVLTSITQGLQYDHADSVCMVITTLKNQILENPYVSKTMKMKTFNTKVIQNIVNLYNWKGPQGINSVGGTVDEFEKYRVNESVHAFLLALCTSPKYGIIFLDRNLGRKDSTNQNPLMVSVLKSLERPWEHSYAGELVTKICKACPGLVRTMWHNLHPFLETRPTVKWVNAIKFARALLKELEPSCVEYCVKEMDVHELEYMVKALIAPKAILSILVKNEYKCHAIRYYVLLFALDILKSIHSYLVSLENLLSETDYASLRKELGAHILHNLPKPINIFNNWDKLDEDLESYFESFSKVDYLKVMFKVFEFYADLSSDLLEDDEFYEKLDLNEFLERLLETSMENSDEDLFLRAVKLFANLCSTSFLPDGSLFGFVFPEIVRIYHKNRDNKSRDILKKLFENSSIFTGCEFEIDVWVDAVLASKNYTTELSHFILKCFLHTYNHQEEQMDYLVHIKNALPINEGNGNLTLEELLEELELGTDYSYIIRDSDISPFIIGFLNELTQCTISKSLKNYYNFVIINLLHLQTDPGLLIATFKSEKYSALCDESFSNYLMSWSKIGEDIVSLPKYKGCSIFSSFSSQFLDENFKNYIQVYDENTEHFPDQKTNLLHMSLFYLANLIKLNKINRKYQENWEIFLDFLSRNFYENYVDIIFGHPVLLHYFTPLQTNETEENCLICTEVVVNLIKLFQKLGYEKQLESYMKTYRKTVVQDINKMLKKPQKYVNNLEKFLDLIEICELEHQQCADILEKFASVNVKKFNGSPVLYKILVYILNKFVSVSKTMNLFEPLKETTIIFLNNTLIVLNSKEVNTAELAEAYWNYLQIFSHNIANIDKGVFETILHKNEYCKDSVRLAIFIFEKLHEEASYIDVIKSNIEKAASKKGIMLPMLEIIIKYELEDLYEIVYKNIEHSLKKALNKPQKAGQHFENHYKSVGKLLSMYLTENECKNYLETTQKYETSEIFHAYLLETIFSRCLLKTFSGKYFQNTLLTFVHLQLHLFKKKTKQDEEWHKLEKIAEIFCTYLQKFDEDVIRSASLEKICQNENFVLYCKFCLKFGLSGKTVLLKSLALLSDVLEFLEENASGFMEMIVSHSEFLELLLNENNDCKTELLHLFVVLVKRWPIVMDRSHVPMLLAAYRATMTKSDLYILNLLRMYEEEAGKTDFYSFKPFLWGTAAASHYSVHTDIRNTLWRQPKPTDVLKILDENLVHQTILKYPLGTGLLKHKVDSNVDSATVYDLSFLLSVFSQILAPEMTVKTYYFTRSGALALTITALSSQDENIRHAACHVLERFYKHVEARNRGKDNVLWSRLVEAICSGAAVLKDMKLDNFASQFFAKASLILTEPTNVMYSPLCNYLAAKQIPNLKSIPELYTLLHSSEVNFEVHRKYILEVVRDGLRTVKDFEIFLHSMAYKLIMELFDSELSDLNTKLLILDIFIKALETSKGVYLLCSCYGLLSWLYTIVLQITENATSILPKILQMCSKILDKKQNGLDLTFIGIILNSITSEHLNSIKNDDILILLLKDILTFLLLNLPFNFTLDNVKELIKHTNNQKCDYLLKYGCKFFDLGEDTQDVDYYLTKIVVNYGKLSNAFM